MKSDGPEPEITKPRCRKEYVRLLFNQNPNNYLSSEINVIICQQAHHGAKVYTRATELAVVALLSKQHSVKLRNLSSPVRTEPIDCVATPSYIINRKYAWI